MDLRSIINTEAGESSAPKSATPMTPNKAGPPSQPFREPPPASLSKHPSQEYVHQAAGPYASPTAYQGGYHGRPSGPPPLLPPSQNELRSPAASSHYSSQSPYRHTPSSSVSGGGYPFSQQTPQSPAAPHSYPVTLQHRESYSQSTTTPIPLQHHNSYSQVSPVPQTPPIGVSNTPQGYFQHQRSQSSQSNSTPTSAHSQQPYHNQYPHDSPVSASALPSTQLPQHQRQQSQPGTPLGPPAAIARHSSGGFAQPTSPYQQRPQSSGMIPVQRTNPHTSPPPVIPASQAILNSRAPIDSQQRSSTEVHRSSQSERERSISVSPKTQLPGLPKAVQVTDPPLSNGTTSSTKRKIDDREGSEATSNPSVNGEHSSHSHPLKKRVRYTEPPIWARSITGMAKHGNSSVNKKRKMNGGPQSEGKSQHDAASDRSVMNGYQPNAPHLVKVEVHSNNLDPDRILGAWEPSITGLIPYDEISSVVADWLYAHVVDRPDAGELASRGVEVEIEAKLGQLVDKETNERYYLPVATECVLVDTGRVTFKSTMTETQHKQLNDFLNEKVKETHPLNSKREPWRVAIVYAHRNERDKFYELPVSFQSSLPACVRRQLKPRHSVRVRVTTDEKTDQVLAKIIKTRVSDLDIYMPKRALDCRISINLEMKYEGSVEELVANPEVHELPDRSKNRLSYTHSHYQIDLTQVITSMPKKGEDVKEHELEIELSSAKVREQGRLLATDQPHKYPELVQGLVDNVRVLTRMRFD